MRRLRPSEDLLTTGGCRRFVPTTTAPVPFWQGRGKCKVVKACTAPPLRSVSCLTQTMNLLLLAPDIQEAALFLLLTDGRCATIRERYTCPIAGLLD